MTPKLFFSLLRLRTLPLSLSGVVLGTMLAASDYHIQTATVIFTILTACGLQIISNLSNELGDFLNGTISGQGRDSAVSLVNGQLTQEQMKRMIFLWVTITIILGLCMIYSSFGTLFSLDSFVLMIVGFFAIKAAMKYTLGKSPYGYRGLGDLYVFFFFGIVSVIGSFFVLTHSFGTYILLLPACSIGFFSTAVLNVNNIRDIESDRQNRVTVAIKLGEKGAKVYQIVLILAGWISMTVYASLRIFDLWHFLYLVTLPAFILHIIYIWKNTGRKLDKSLPILVISTFVFALISGFGFVAYLLI